MRKKEYTLEIGKFKFKFYVSNEKTIEKSAKTALRRSGKSYIEIAQRELDLKLEKCPFCNSNSNYFPVFEIDNELKKIVLVKLDLLKEKNGLVNKHCKRGKDLCEGGRNNPNSKKYISIAYGISEKEANEYLLSRNKSPFYSINHKNEDEYKNFQSRNLEWYINKYGETEGNLKYKSFVKKMEIRSSTKYMIEKHGDEFASELNSKKAQTLSSFIKKYGDIEGPIKWEEYKKSVGLSKKEFIRKHGIERWNMYRESINMKKSLDYYIQIYGYAEGTKKHQELIKSYSFTKEDYINKYGEEKWIERSKLNRGLKFYSKEACSFFELLFKKLENENIKFENIKWKEDEFFLWDSDFKRIYFYDLYFEINNKKIIIEYDNSFWHPKNDEDKNFINSNFSNITYSEKKEYDERKTLWAKYNGFYIINLYFNEKKNPARCETIWNPYIEKLIEEIKNILK
jgi:hypothetical protein